VQTRVTLLTDSLFIVIEKHDIRSSIDYIGAFWTILSRFGFREFLASLFYASMYFVRRFKSIWYDRHKFHQNGMCFSERRTRFTYLWLVTART